MRIAAPLPPIIHPNKIKLPNLFDIPLFKPGDDEVDPEESKKEAVAGNSMKDNFNLIGATEVQISYAVTPTLQSENFISNCVNSVSGYKQIENAFITNFFKKE